MNGFRDDALAGHQAMVQKTALFEDCNEPSVAHSRLFGSAFDIRFAALLGAVALAGFVIDPRRLFRRHASAGRGQRNGKKTKSNEHSHPPSSIDAFITTILVWRATAPDPFAGASSGLGHVIV